MQESNTSIFSVSDHLLFQFTAIGCEDKYMESDEFYSFYNVYNVIVLCLAPINVILNGLSLKVFGHRLWKNSPMSAILKSLSVFEICFGSSLFFHTIVFRVLETFTNNSSHDTSDLSKFERHNQLQLLAWLIVSRQILTGFLFAFQVTRNWSVVILAAYRYDAICRPIGTPSHFPRERIFLIMGTTFLFALLFSLPRIFEIKAFICEPNVLIYHEAPLLAEGFYYRLIYLGIGAFTVQSGGPVLCVCILSFFVIRKMALRRRFRRRNQHARLSTTATKDVNSGVESLSTTKVVERSHPSGDKLMLALCLTFFVLETPSFFSKILSSYTSRNYPTLDAYISVIANLLIYLDSTFNVFVYMASNPTFRKAARLIFFHKTLRQQPKQSVSRSSDVVNVTNQ